MIRLFFLGYPRIERAGQPVKMDTRKATALLAYLALTRTAHGRDSLAALLWPEFDEQRARGALRRTLSTLRKGVGADCLEISRQSVALVPERVTVDVWEFVALAGKDDERAAELYADDFLTGFTLRDAPAFDEWHRQQSERLRATLRQCLHDAAAQSSAREDGETALAYGLRLLQLEPFDEAGHRMVMQLYADMGQRSDALKQFAELETLLDEEFGVQPEAATVALLRQIEEVGSVPSPSGAAEPQQINVRRLPLIGRNDAWGELIAGWKRVEQDGFALFLSGEAGIGKTRLADTFCTQLERDGAVVLRATCFEGEEELAYEPLIGGLRPLLREGGRAWVNRLPQVDVAAAARLWPELGATVVESAAATDSLVARHRFFAGVAAVVCAVCDVVWIDDVQWMDAATREWLVWLLRRLKHRPIFILLTFRPNQSPTVTTLERVSAELQRRQQATALSLSRLSATEVRQLATAAALPDAAAWLTTESEGVPYFVCAYLQLLRDGVTPDGVPADMRDLMRSRMGGVNSAELHLLQAASVIGQSIDLALLPAVSGQPEEALLTDLESLIGCGLLQEATTGYGFSHNKLRDMIYDETSQLRRRVLHRRAAEAHVQLAEANGSPAAAAAQIAVHFREANQSKRAAQYFLAAADHARSLYANDAAQAHYEAALALHPQSAGRACSGLGELALLAGRYQNALRLFEQAMAHGGETGLMALRMGQVCARLGKWDSAEMHLLAAKSAGNPSSEFAATLQIEQCRVALAKKEIAAATRLATSALGAAQATHDSDLEATARNVLGAATRQAGQPETAIRQLRDALAIAKSEDVRAAIANNLALTLQEAGESAEALILLEQSLAGCMQIGDLHGEAAIRNNKADLLHATGDTIAAQKEIARAARLYAAIQQETGTLNAEVWRRIAW